MKKFVSDRPLFVVVFSFLLLIGSIGWHFVIVNPLPQYRFGLFLSLGIVVFLAFFHGILLFWWHSFRSKEKKPEGDLSLSHSKDLEVADIFFHSRGILPWLEKNLDYVKNIYSNLERISHLLSFINYSIELPRQLRLALALAHEIFPRAVITIFLWRDKSLLFGMASRMTTRGMVEELKEFDFMVLSAKEAIQEEVDLEKLRAMDGRTFSLPLKVESNSLSISVMPLILWNRVLGFIVYHFLEMEPLSSDEKVVATLLTRHIAVFVENHYLYQEKVQQQRIGHEIEIARQIQESSLPATVPEFPGYSFAFSCQPCSEISGDYYDLILRNEKEMLVTIADVSGKGFPASLFLSKIQTLVRALAGGIASPAELLTFLSRHMVQEQMGSLFATMFIAIVRSDSHSVVCANAGHCHPIVVRSKAGFVEEVVFDIGIPLGLFEPSGDEYQDHTIELMPGDGVFLYSDGLPELVGQNRERLGTEKIKEILDRATESDPKSLFNLLQKEIKAFQNDTPLEDDVTMVYLKSEPIQYG